MENVETEVVKDLNSLQDDYNFFLQMETQLTNLQEWIATQRQNSNCDISYIVARIIDYSTRFIVSSRITKKKIDASKEKDRKLIEEINDCKEVLKDIIYSNKIFNQPFITENKNAYEVISLLLTSISTPVPLVNSPSEAQELNDVHFFAEIFEVAMYIWEQKKKNPDFIYYNQEIAQILADFDEISMNFPPSIVDLSKYIKENHSLEKKDSKEDINE